MHLSYAHAFNSQELKILLFVLGLNVISNIIQVHAILIYVFVLKKKHIIYLTLSQTSPAFNMSAVQAFLNTVQKGEIARTDEFLLFPQCFLTDGRIFCHFHQI